MIPVYWTSYHDSPARGYWDAGLIEWLLAHPAPGLPKFRHLEGKFPIAPGGIVAMPAHGGGPSAKALSHDLKEHGWEWALIILNSDEEASFPFWEITHPRHVVYKLTHNPSSPWHPDLALPLGWAGPQPDLPSRRKVYDWVFAGQVNHPRRKALVEALRGLPDGFLVETEGFGQGLLRAEYLDKLNRAKVAPCPAGNQSPDSFRMYEALELGCVPIADASSPRGDRGYWGHVFPQGVPFPVIEDWATVPQVITQILSDWDRYSVEVGAWWGRVKRDLQWRLRDDLIQLSGEGPEWEVPERITALITASPIPSHPDTRILDQTIASVRSRLPDSEIIIAFDGVRPEQAHYAEAYAEHMRRIISSADERTVILPCEWGHQANTARKALELIRTPLVLFMEHDTPLTGKIPLARLGELVLGEEVNSIRFHHETRIPAEHRWLMDGPIFYDPNIRLQRTRQWSQRPHLARTDWYRQVIDKHFTPTSRTFIEDVMHGVVERTPWDEWKLSIFEPEDCKRSLHLDGRADDPKFGF